MSTRTRTIRVDDEVWAAIQALPGRTQNEAFRGLLVDGGLTIGDRLDAILALLRQLPIRESGPVGTMLGEATETRPKNAFCKHCGNRFAGQRHATICSDCKASGHTLTPTECPICSEPY